MPQPKKAARFGGDPAHHKMILANLATELIRHGRVRTTLAKARTVQPLAEKMITFGKRGDVHARRQVLRVIRDKDVVHKLFTDVGPAFAERPGGYTRVLKLGNRKGDAAPMALIELVEGVVAQGEGDLSEQPRRRWSLRRRKGTLSQSAREIAEERQAAVDRGEDVVYDEEYEEDTEDVPGEQELTDPDGGVQADPAEVEARLAAQDAEVDAPVDDEGADTAADDEAKDE
ncbi:MAG: 50S ribosomal protein L17 [Nitriliruptorales bacterium]|nr:50S ribosomal protein L17 [Nitriliruptorales bacterium]